MASVKISKNLSPKPKDIRYTGTKTFLDWRDNLVNNLAKVYFPDTYNDFNESSPGMLFIESAAAIGDVLSYYIDTQFKENLLLYTQDIGNIITIAQAMGYKTRPAASATVTAQFYQIVPALNASQSYNPDPRYFMKISAGMIASSQEFGNVNFRTVEDLDFSVSTNQQITVYSINSSNQPLTYLVQKSADIVSGDIKTLTYDFGNPEKFSVITIPDNNVLEIVSVVDSNGNVWNEVDYLAQDLVFDDSANLNPNTSGSNSPEYILQLKKTPRRFITRYNSDFECELHFGSGVLDDSSEIIGLDAGQIASSEYQLNLASTSLDPADFLSSRSYGLAPSNISLTIQYTVGNGILDNVPSNTITNIKTYNVIDRGATFTTAESQLYDQIKKTLGVNNTNPATGGSGQESVEEIRQNALAFFNSQNRLVTAADYIVRTYAMPPKYGSVAKAYVMQDDQINTVLQQSNPSVGSLAVDAVNPNAINLYVLGYNQNGNLTTLNSQVKQNLKQYLDTYRMLTDQVNILDGFVVNIGVNFSIVVYKNYNMNDVLAQCIDSIQTFFDISRWQLNQPIVINDLQMQVLQVDGVQNVTNIEIVNKYAFKDGSDYANFVYDISAATDPITGIIYNSMDPCIFEIRYPNIDIRGSALQ